MRCRPYDICIRCEDTEEVPQMVSLADRFGYAGIALLISGEDDEILETIKSLSSMRERISCGVEISASSVSDLKRKINRFSGRSYFLAFRSSNDEKVNRAAVRDFRVDFIANPSEGADLGAVDVRFAAENAVSIEFNMQSIIKSRRKERAQVLGKMRSLLKFVRKYRAMPLLTSGAHSIYEMRAPREIIALAYLIGMRREEAMSALCEIPEGILSRKWKSSLEKSIEICY